MLGCRPQWWLLCFAGSHVVIASKMNGQLRVLSLPSDFLFLDDLSIEWHCDAEFILGATSGHDFFSKMEERGKS